MFSPTVRLSHDNYSYAHKSFKPLHPDSSGPAALSITGLLNPTLRKKRLIHFPERYSSMTSRLSLFVLADNTTLTDQNCCGEAGLSFFIETAGKRILFDTGLSGLFLTNAEKMGLDLRNLDCLILSHGHIDQTGGLATLARHLAGPAPAGTQNRVPRLIAHPRCFWPK